jgi:hypothetical protein
MESLAEPNEKQQPPQLTPDLYTTTSAQIERALSTYGSIERWPTLRLLPTQFTTCTCGCGRLNHKLAGTQRLGCNVKDHTCDGFRAPIAVDKKRR